MNIKKMFRKLRKYTEEESPCELDRAAAVLMKLDGSECIVYAGNTQSVKKVLEALHSEGEVMKGKSSRINDDEVSKEVDDLIESIVEAKRREKTAKEG